MVDVSWRGKAILEDALIADTFITRLTGFMFRKEPHHQAILINPCNSIHTFFMRFSIDVLFVNEKMEVIKKIQGLKAGRVILPVKGAKVVIEGKEGSFNNLEVGDKILIEV